MIIKRYKEQLYGIIEVEDQNGKKEFKLMPVKKYLKVISKNEQN